MDEKTNPYKILRKVGQKFRVGDEVQLTGSQALYYHHLQYIVIPNKQLEQLAKEHFETVDYMSTEDENRGDVKVTARLPSSFEEMKQAISNELKKSGFIKQTDLDKAMAQVSENNAVLSENLE